MTVTSLIQTQRAVREFTAAPVSEEHIRAILNAGRRAQSSKNSQPWQFIVIRDRATLQQLATCGQYAGHLAGAAFAIALVSAAEATFDLGQAAAYMQLAAWELGIGSCIAAMWEPDKARAILGIPAGHHFDLAISFGYPAPRPDQPAGLRKGGRRSLDEVVRWEHW
ncbi:MAG TPA: nitroreductase family protein [Chloroflexia bacterium]|nr:nitroreductase family protein [Chloroflexia bacterium]